jgi:hypothetical protein
MDLTAQCVLRYIQEAQNGKRPVDVLAEVLAENGYVLLEEKEYNKLKRSANATRFAA